MFKKTSLESQFNEDYENNLKGLENDENIIDFDVLFNKQVKEIARKNEEKEKLFRTIKENIFLTNNEKFFKSKLNSDFENVVKIIDTGVGKTYNTVYLALYNLFYTDRKILISTTKNENVIDIKKEFFKILKNNIIDKIGNKENDEILNTFMEKPTLNCLRICELNSLSNYNKTQLKESRVIITNHSYLLEFGQSDKLRKSSILLNEIMGNNSIILIDEIDEFEKQALISIPINGFYKNAFTVDKLPILKYSKSAFISYEKDYFDMYINQCRYTLPHEINTFIYDKRGQYDEPYYKIDKDGTLNLKEFIEKYFYINTEFIDNGRREGFLINTKNGKLNLLRTTIFKSLEFNYSDYDRVNYELNTENDFIRLLKESQGVFLTKSIIELTKKDRLDNGEIAHELIERFENRNDFIEYCKKNMEIEEYDAMMHKLIKEGYSLYREYVVIRRKGILEKLKGTKYLYTATPSCLEKIGYTLDYEEKIPPHTIKEIDIFFKEQKKSIDKSIIDISLNKFKDKDINVLAFVAEKRNLHDYVIKKDEIMKDNKYKNVKLITSTTDANTENDIKAHPVSLGNSSDYLEKKENVTISFLNGTESTGKNYCDTDVCIINCRVEYNEKARVEIGKTYKGITDIEDASFRTVIQAGGRIERTGKKKQVYKADILIGENRNMAYKYIESKKGNGIKYNIFFEKDINKIIENIDKKIKFHNKGEKDININLDKKKKYEKDIIIKFYLNLLSDDLTEKDAKNLTIDEFNIKRCYLNTLIREYKDKL